MGIAQTMSRSEIVAAIAALDQAMHEHEEWCNDIYGSLICGRTPNPRDLEDDAHHRCPFGHWYDGRRNEKLGEHPGFVAIDATHQELHRLARRMLRVSRSGDAVDPQDFDVYLDAIKALRDSVQSLRHELSETLTNLDPLTGAASRVGMMSRLRTHQAIVGRNGPPCTIAMMDLDHFKDVNDAHGHQAGDAVLVATAQHVITQLRPYDEFFRYGGEEFLFVFPGTDIEASVLAVERIREEMAHRSIEIGAGRHVEITASFGVVALAPDVTVETSVARADRALYQAKANGRNQTQRWVPSMG